MPNYRVKELAEKQGLTIARLHQEALRHSPGSRVAYRTVYDLWHNKTRRPDIETLRAVARALGVPVGNLLVNNEDLEEDLVPGLVAA